MRLNLNILVAEDNTINQKVAQRLLTRKGHTVTLVDNGIQAVKAVKENDFDLILMDASMPEMDGFAATKAIRALNDDIPIIAVTAHPMVSNSQRFIDSGMTDYVKKPINAKILEETIQRVVTNT